MFYVNNHVRIVKSRYKRAVTSVAVFLQKKMTQQALYSITRISKVLSTGFL